MKSEKDKMLSGDLYDASDKELMNQRQLAKSVMYEFNNNHPDQREKGANLLSELLNTTGHFNIEAPFYFDYGYNIHLGENFYANHGLCILDVCKVSIGDNVLFGPYVQIYTATHPIDPKSRLTGLELGVEITIGDNVWIGGGSIISPGVTIGDNVTIGAGSVVTKDIPANVVAVGNPCKVIKNL